MTQLTEKQIETIKNHTLDFEYDCPFDGDNEIYCNNCPLNNNGTCNDELYHKAKVGMLDADYEEKSKAKLNEISKKEYFNMQIQLCNSIQHGVELLKATTTAQHAKDIVDEALSLNGIKVVN